MASIAEAVLVIATAPIWISYCVANHCIVAYQRPRWEKAQLVDKHGDPQYPHLAAKYKGKQRPTLLGQK